MFPAGSGSAKIRGYVDQIRHNRWFFLETKSRLEIIYFIYLLVTIPIDFSRILKCLLIGQYNMLRFRLTPETKHAATSINNFISSKISGIGFLHKLYTKLIDYMYKFATQNPGQWWSIIPLMLIFIITNILNANNWHFLLADHLNNRGGGRHPLVYVTRTTSPGK